MNRPDRENRPTIFDCHAHLYSPSVIASVSRRDGLATALGLKIEGAIERTDKSALIREARAAGVRACLLLPIAPPDGVHTVNELFVKTVEGEKTLYTAGTLHPLSHGIDEELEWLNSKGVRTIKLCSFSQNFDLESEETLQLFGKIRSHNLKGGTQFFVLLDTFYNADIYFGTPRRHLTTPEKLGRLAAFFPEINFVGAHMGGLSAPFDEVDCYLAPRGNLYLDTTNASHALPKEKFLRLIDRHGPERILFGTDWPWFHHGDEVTRIQRLLQEAGLSAEDQSLVFSGNICRLLGAGR